MPNLVIVFLIIVALNAILLFVSGPRKFRKRAKFLSVYTQSKGYALANEPLVQAATTASMRELRANPSFVSFIKGSEGITDIEGLEKGKDDPFAVICNVRGKEVMIFNLKVDSRRTDDRATNLNYRVAKIRCAGLPRFSFGRNSIVHTILSAVDRAVGKVQSDIHLDARNADPNGASAFEKHFWLKGSDRDAILTFLSSAKLQFLASARLPGTVATNANYIVYFEDGRLRSEADFDSFIDTTDKIVANLL
jgi:hypothetical protein